MVGRWCLGLRPAAQPSCERAAEPRDLSSGRGRGCREAPDPPQLGLDTLLSGSALRQLRRGEQQLSERNQRGFIVLDRGRRLMPPRQPPEPALQQPVRHRAAHLAVEVVAVAEHDLADAMARIGDLDLGVRKPPSQERLEEEASAPPLAQLVVGFGRGDPQLDQRLEPANEDVVIVVAGQPHQPLAGQRLCQQLDQPVGAFECVLDRREQQIDEVTEQHDLVCALELGTQRLASPGIGEQVIPRPRAKVCVRDH
jgi:hypothetical protein